MTRFLVLYSFVFIYLFTGCSKDDDPVVPASRTLLVYMAADNSLDRDVAYSLKQMKQAINYHDGNLIVYIDRLKEPPRLIRIQPTDTVGIEVLLKTYEEENSASKETFSRVVRETKELFPSSSYGLILWSHGLGWVPGNHSSAYAAMNRTGVREFPRTKYIGVDDTGGRKFLEIPDLAAAIQDHAFDFILFDACLMSSIETFYELRNKCDYFIAAPTEILAEPGSDASGMPYHKMLHYLYGTSDDLRRACEIYCNHYDEKDGLLRSATIALIKSAELEELYGITRRMLSGKQELVAAMNTSSLQGYATSGVPRVFFDFSDFISQLQFVSAEDKTAFRQQMDKVVVYKNTTDRFIDFTIDKSRFSGVSTYVPRNVWKNNKEYAFYFQLEWAGVY